MLKLKLGEEGKFMYGIEPMFWMKLFLLISIFLLFSFIFNTVISKWLKVEKKKFFSYDHVNEKHKKIDWTIRMAMLVSLSLGYFINITRDPMEWFWFLETWFLVIIFIVVSETARAVMEWKYAENPKAHMLTISQLVFVVILLFTTFKTDFFGLF